MVLNLTLLFTLNVGGSLYCISTCILNAGQKNLSLFPCVRVRMAVLNKV